MRRRAPLRPGSSGPWLTLVLAWSCWASSTPASRLTRAFAAACLTSRLHTLSLVLLREPCPPPTGGVLKLEANQTSSAASDPHTQPVSTWLDPSPARHQRRIPIFLATAPAPTRSLPPYSRAPKAAARAAPGFLFLGVASATSRVCASWATSRLRKVAPDPRMQTTASPALGALALRRLARPLDSAGHTSPAPHYLTRTSTNSCEHTSLRLNDDLR